MVRVCFEAPTIVTTIVAGQKASVLMLAPIKAEVVVVRASERTWAISLEDKMAFGRLTTGNLVNDIRRHKGPTPLQFALFTVFLT
jgi:hypothetical protein